MKKKIKDLTLKEINKICEKQNSCQECVFSQHLCKRGALSDVLAKCFSKNGVENQEIELEETCGYEYERKEE